MGSTAKHSASVVAGQADVSALIGNALVEAELSQTQLARLLAGSLADAKHVDSVRRLVGRWVRGEHAPSPVYASRLAEIFGKPTDYFTSPGAASNGPRRSLQMVDAEFDAVEYARETARYVAEATPPRTLSLPMKQAAIRRVVPHFNGQHILLDQVIEAVPGKHVVAEKKFSRRDWELGPWYHGTDIVPAILLVESLAQAAALALLLQPLNHGRLVLCAGFNHTRFKRIVRYNEKVTLDVSIGRTAAHVARAKFTASVDGEVAVRGELILAIS